MNNQSRYPMPAKKMLRYCVIIIGTLLLMIPAFYNHYPLVNPDTATYIASGFKLETPMDRPITYGLFIRAASLNGISLWLVIFAQGLIVSALICALVQRLSGGNRFLLHSFLTIVILSLFTSLSWVVSQVQPDVFTSVGVMTVILILLNRGSKASVLWYYLLFFICAAMHLSHPLLFSALIAFLFLFRRFLYSKQIADFNRKLLVMLVLSLSSLVLMGAALSKSSHVFLVGSLLEKGVLKKYLDDQCDVKHYRLCVYKDALPMKLDDFIWNDSSPLYKVGDWKGSKTEFKDMIHGVFTSRKYLWAYGGATLRQALCQAVTFGIGDGNTAFVTGSNVNNQVVQYFPRELKYFNAAGQNTAGVRQLLTWPNQLFAVVVLLSLSLVAIMMTGSKIPSTDTRVAIVVCASGLLLNIADIAACSVTNGRYGCKMIWLIPFCAIICLFQWGNMRSRDSVQE
jgi:hypothetical protein